MPSYFTQIFSNVMVPPAVKRNLDFSYRHLPMLNEVSTSLSSYLASQGQISRKKALMRWYKGSPELVAFVNKVVNDCCNFYHFEPVGTRTSGKNNVRKTNRFAMENGFRQMRAAILADALITGDGFTWLGKIPKNVIKDKVKEMMDKYSLLEMKGEVPKLNQETKEKIASEISIEFKASLEPESDDIDDDSDFVDEDVLAPKKFRYMPSSTVEVVYDRYDVKGYNHFLGVYLPMFFSPDEIIHFTMMKRDGRVNGFTPVESVIDQLELLRQMWQNQLALHRNGGAPDKVFNVKNLQVSSPAYKRIEEQIQKYKIAENKHGNMLFTGDLNVVDLQQLDEMQFKDMGLYITGLIAMQWGLPRSSIPFIVGGTNTKDDTGGNAERGYWQMIRGMQMVESELWNTQLWIPYFKVKLVPELSFPQLEVQEEAARQAKIQNLQNIDAMLLKDKKMLSHEKKLEVLGITDDDIEDAPEEEINKQMGLNPDGSNPNQLNLGTPKTSKDKPDSSQGVGKAVAKRQEQQNTIASRGKPTGYGKEIDDLKETIMELKGFIAGTIQSAIIPTRYENQPKVRKDEPISQLVDNNQGHSSAFGSELVVHGPGPSMPSDWAINKDNAIRDKGVQDNYRDKPMFHSAQIVNPQGDIPTAPSQQSFAPGNLLNNSNLDNPAGNLNYQGKFNQAEEYNKLPDANVHDTPETKPEKRKGKYPSQMKYPDEPTQFPGKDEKTSQLQMGIRVEGEHRDVYAFIRETLKKTGKLPPFEEVAKGIAKDHLAEISDYYTRLKKMEANTKLLDSDSEIEFKSMQGSEDECVSPETFTQIYMEDRRYNSGKPPRIFMRRSYGIVTLKFKSNDFVYKTQVSEQDLKTPKMDILFSNLSGNVYRL